MAKEISNLITFNTYKFEKGGLLVDMYDQFNARVGDQGTELAIQWENSKTETKINLKERGLHFFATGSVGQYLEKLEDNSGFKMSADASTVEWEDKDGAGTLDDGITIAKLPKQFFPQKGIFFGYFGLKDQQGNVFTSVNVWFRVLGGVPTMGAAIPYFVTEFDEVLERCNGKIVDTLAELREKYQAEVKSNEDMSSTTRAALSKLADAVGAIQAQIDAGNVVTRKDFAQGLDKVSGEITNRLAKMDNGVHAFATAQTIKDKYPTGADGIFVAVDTGHQWYWSDGAWVDAGPYQASGLVLPDEKLGRTVIAYPYGGSDSITFGKENGQLTINLAGNSVYIYGTKDKDFSNAELLSAFSNAKIDTVSVTGQKISGTDFVLAYRPSTDELLVGKLSVEYMYSDIILIANEYGKTLWGPLVDYAIAKNTTAPALAYHVYSATSSFWYHRSITVSPYRLSDSKRTIKIPATGFYVRTNVSRIEVSQNTLDDFLTKANIGFDTDKREILSNDLILYYDLQANQLGSANSNYILSDDQLPLLIVSYKNELSGAWIDSSHNYNDTLAYPGVPDYWRDVLSKKIKQIRQQMVSASSNSFAFLWITDTHWSSNDKNSPALVKAVMDNTNVPYMVHGGDLITQGEKLDMIDSAVDSLKALKQPGYALPVVLGNHDLNSNWADRSANADKIFSYPEMLKLYVNQQATPEGVELVDYPNSLAWQADYSSRGPKRSPQIYGFAWDTNDSSKVTTGQIKAFIELCKRPGYVLSFLHWALDNGAWSTTSREIGKLIDAINTKSTQVELASYGTFQLDGVQAHVVFTLSGHEHQDNVRQTDNGTPQIVTTCDAGRLKANNDAFAYTSGTATEQAFDVFIVDFDAKKIKDIRIGRGNDREFSFV